METKCRRSFLYFDSFKKHRQKQHFADHHDHFNFINNFNVLLNSNNNISSNSNRNNDNRESDYLDFVNFDRNLHSIESVNYLAELQRNLSFFVSELHSNPRT